MAARRVKTPPNQPEVSADMTTDDESHFYKSPEFTTNTVAVSLDRRPRGGDQPVLRNCRRKQEEFTCLRGETVPQELDSPHLAGLISRL